MDGTVDNAEAATSKKPEAKGDEHDRGCQIVCEAGVRCHKADLCSAPLLQAEHAEEGARGEGRVSDAASEQNRGYADVYSHSDHWAFPRLTLGLKVRRLRAGKNRQQRS